MPGTQALVAVNPITLIASICNLFIQLFIFKKFFWDKVIKVIDQRREAADQEIAQAKSSRSEADAMKAAYEQDMKEARDKADEIVMSAQKAATARSAPLGALFPRVRKRKGAHLFIEPKATTRPSGRAKSSVRKKSLAASPQPCRMERVTVQNMGQSPSKA